MINISEIKTPNRMRASAGDLKSLKESIGRIGLLHAIGVTKDNVLVYGFRRLQAAKALGWEEIPYVEVELDEYHQKVAELEENLKRKALTWQEEVRGKRQLHDLYQRIYGKPRSGHRSDIKGPLSDSEKGWGLKDTAEFLDESLALTSQDIKLAKNLEIHPELMKEKKKSLALRKLASIEHPEKKTVKQWKCSCCEEEFKFVAKHKVALCPGCYAKIKEGNGYALVEDAIQKDIDLPIELLKSEESISVIPSQPTKPIEVEEDEGDNTLKLTMQEWLGTLSKRYRNKDSTSTTSKKEVSQHAH